MVINDKKNRLLSVWVKDQDKALDFYLEKLGFEKQTDIEMDNGYRWLEVKPPGAETALTIAKPYPGQDGVSVGGFTNIVFTTEDINATYKDLNANGVKFIEKPKIQEWGVMQAIFADPDDNMFILVERA
jgi:catechol 2,3-dioxygenase-like lactoylglutathione lyase family enzyme